MLTITISGFSSREKLLEWIRIQQGISFQNECPYEIIEDNFSKETSSFQNNLNKKNFDLIIKEKSKNEDNNIS